jgi:hypothetical protein
MIHRRFEPIHGPTFLWFFRSLQIGILLQLFEFFFRDMGHAVLLVRNAGLFREKYHLRLVADDVGDLLWEWFLGLRLFLA